jgi:hypothetical protein
MTAMKDQLTAALSALQRLERRIQLLRKRGQAKPIDSVQAKFALDLIRAIGIRHPGEAKRTTSNRGASKSNQQRKPA